MGFALTLLYVFLTFVRPQELYPTLVEYQIMNIVGTLAIAGSLLSLAAGSRPNLRGLELPLALAFLAWSAFSVAAALSWFGGAAMTFYNLSVSFFACVLIALNVNTRRRLAVAVGTACVSLLIVLFQAIVAYYSAEERSPFFLLTAARGPVDTFIDAPAENAEELELSDDDHTKATTVRRIRGLGFLADPNDLAQALISIIPLSALLWRRGNNFRNILLITPLLALQVWGVLLTRSRGGLIALVLLLAASLVFRFGPPTRRPVLLASGVLAMPAFVALFGYARADSSAAARLEAWAMGLQMLKGSPIWGVGSGFFTDHHNRAAHNSFVQCFAETGTVGYFLWLASIVVTLSRVSLLAESAADASWARWAKALRLSLLAFLFAALFLSRTTSPMLFFLLSLPAALLGIAEKSGEKVPVPRSWWLNTLGLEAASIATIWVTARAFYG